MNLKWAGIMLLAAAASAQNNNTGLPGSSFEVASVKKSLPGRMTGLILPGGAISISGYTLKQMISWAWSVDNLRISGGPKWLDSERYDISAKPASPSKQDEPQMIQQTLQALQALLVDRFQLKLHQETRELPVYALVMARKDGKLGPSLTHSREGDCAAPGPPDISNPSKPLAPLQPGKGPALACGQFFNSRSLMKGVAVGIDALSGALPRILGRPVIDETGLTGKYDIVMEWSPRELRPDTPNDVPPADAGPSLFTAFEEQLGLKLESIKSNQEIVVIDSAEKPGEN